MYDYDDIPPTPPVFKKSARHTTKIINVIKSCITHKQVACTYNWVKNQIKKELKYEDRYDIAEAFIKQKNIINKGVREEFKIQEVKDYAKFGVN